MRVIKLLIFISIIFGFFFMRTPSIFADGCYICEGGDYVKYEGEDTFDKRKEAEKQFQCKVKGTTSSCSKSKGTVGEKKK